MVAKNLSEVIDVVIALFKAGKLAIADGKVDVKDLLLLMEVLPKLPAAVADIDEVPSEVAALDEAAYSELVAKIASELAVDNAKAGLVAQHALKIAYHGFMMVKELKA